MRQWGAVSGWSVRGKERFGEINYFRRKFLICSLEGDTVTVLKGTVTEELRDGVFKKDCLGAGNTEESVIRQLMVYKDQMYYYVPR